jgi:hypothetical protein
MKEQVPKTITIKNIPHDARILIASDNGDNNGIPPERIILNEKISNEFQYLVTPNKPVIIRVRLYGWKAIEIRSHHNNFNEHLVVRMRIDNNYYK